METTALTDNKLVMYTSEQVQQMLDMVVRSLSRQGQNNTPVNLDNVINQVTPSDAKITLTVTEAADMLGISLPKICWESLCLRCMKLCASVASRPFGWARKS